MTGYSERTISLKNVMECLIKVHTFFESICGKSQLDGWMKFYKKYLWSAVYRYKKTTPELGICMLQIFVTISTAGWYGPACPVQL